jgi:polyphosphate glucokinase
VIHSAVNLLPAWTGGHLDRLLLRALRKPVRVANDADIQGLGVIRGDGVELLITLGTGVGSALFVDGVMVPGLEMGHHPYQHGKTYEDLLSDRELKRVGKHAWIHRLRGAVETLQHAFNPRWFYLGGGNARLLSARLWPRHVVIVDNLAGLFGGAALWADATVRARPRPARGARSASASGARRSRK